MKPPTKRRTGRAKVRNEPAVLSELDVEGLADPPLGGRAWGEGALDGLAALDGPEGPYGTAESDVTEAPDETKAPDGTEPIAETAPA